MKLLHKILILTGVLLITSFSTHKYYFSITKIEVDESSKLLKIYSQVFMDDFEKLLQKRYQMSVKDFSALSEKEKKIIEKYVTTKLKLSVNRAPINLKLLGCDSKNELLYIFVEGNYKEEVKRLKIENTMLQDVFTEQQNKVDITYKNKVKSLNLNSEITSGVLFYE